MKTLALRIGLFAIAIYIMVPCSVTLSNKIEEVYQVSSQITSEEESEIPEEESAEEEEEGDFWSKLQSGVQGATTAIVNSAQKTLETAETMLNNFIEAIAIMIILDCVFPILILWLFMWMIKNLLSINIEIPSGNKHRLDKEIEIE